MAYGHDLPGHHARILRGYVGACGAVFIGRRWEMNWLYVIGAGLSLALLVYLSVALLWPERFS